MHFNAGPWARLIRALPLPQLFLFAVVSIGVSVGALELSFGPLPFLHPVLPLFAVLGGVGVAALLGFVFRVVWAGGRSVRIVAGVILGVAVIAGSVVGYSVRVVRARAWRACLAASSDPSAEQRASALVEGRASMASVFFRIAKLVRNDSSVEEQCAYADTDDARRALGLCPRVIEGDATCRCGFRSYPRDLVRDARCPSIACDGRDGAIGLSCTEPPSAAPASGSAPSGQPLADPWSARLGVDDLLKAEPVRLDGDYALRVTLRGAAPDDLEVIRERCRTLYEKARPDLEAERPPPDILTPGTGNVALILDYEESDHRGATSFDPRLAKMTTVVEGDGVVLQDHALYAIEMSPVTEVSFTPTTSILCKGTIKNLTPAPLDLTVECLAQEAGKDKPTPNKVPRAKVSLAPGASASYEVHPPGDEGFNHRHVVRERGKEDAAPIEAFNRLSHDHGKDWIGLHERLRRSAGVRFHNPFPALPPSHTDHGETALSLPDKWEEMDAKARDQVAREIWKAMSTHYRKWHSDGVGTVHLYAGREEAWLIDEGRLKKKSR